MADEDDGVDGERRGQPPSPSDYKNNEMKFDDQQVSGILSSAGRSFSTSAIASPLALDSRGSNSTLTRNDSDMERLPPLHGSLPKDNDVPHLAPTDFLAFDGLNDRSGVAEPFQRLASPPPDLQRNEAAAHEKARGHGVCRMHKFSVYETAIRYYIVGEDMDRRFRILKIDRNVDVGALNVAEDDIVYTKDEMEQLLKAIGDENKSTGGMKQKYSRIWGLLGFIRFTGPYYMLLITKRSQVAMIGGHYVYQIEGTELVPLVTAQNSRFKPDSRNAEEARFLGILNNLDLSRSFYFSYSYDITRTLQHNIIKERDALVRNLPCPHPPDYNDMFVWNNYLLQPAKHALKNTYDWCIPIIHGYIDQAGRFQIYAFGICSNFVVALSIYGRTVHITIIARRSRFFAGARFLKRGANDLVSRSCPFLSLADFFQGLCCQ